jgi:hypothetical protein
MAIDDHPFDALEKHFNLEDSSVSPLINVLLWLTSFVSWIWPFDKAFLYLKNRASADSAHRIKVMLDTCMNEVRKHDAELAAIRVALNSEEAKAREESTAELVVDAVRKAINTRSPKRVQRIGVILANGLIQKTLHPDYVEEMMRIAVDLNDTDISYLGELVRVEGEMVASRGRIERYEAHNKWEDARWGASLNPELDSVFSKLASYGLVAPIPPPNNLNILADFQNRYALLPKGLHFYTLITTT